MKNNWSNTTNMTMLTDFYELSMSKGYFNNGIHEQEVIFDMFFRSVPQQGGYAIMAGVEQLVEYLENLNFSREDIVFLKNKYGFEEEFLNYLERFEFKCDVWTVREGTPIFPNEPIVKVRGPLIQAQMIETMILITINHQSLIATKANRIVRAAKGRPVLEFGARRAQGCDGAVLGARAAYIGGVKGTSCTICGKQFDIPLTGTMAHSWVQIFDSEYESFLAYAKSYPENTVLLIDTYNVLESGVPNAIKVQKEYLDKIGKRLKGVRIDSGDLAYLSIKARKMLDDAGMSYCKIIASNALDEYLIRDLIVQGAKIDFFGVGERLITSRAEPVFGGVYKLSAVISENKTIPKMKISENPGKITNPGDKKLLRFFDKDTHEAIADVIALNAEQIDPNEPFELFDEQHTWKRKVAENYYIKELLEPLFVKGESVYKPQHILQVQEYCNEQTQRLWESVKRFENPQNYYVDLTQKLWDLKYTMIRSLK